MNLVDFIAKLNRIDISVISKDAMTVINLTGLTFSWIIAILSLLHIVKEYTLSVKKIIGVDYEKEVIRQLIQFLTDSYGWKGTCRSTFFIPHDKKTDRIKIYDRISAGRPPGEFDKNCYFKMQQGIPGRAWANAWTGENLIDLIKAELEDVLYVPSASIIEELEKVDLDTVSKQSNF
jgi:hypothetical protein